MGVRQVNSLFAFNRGLVSAFGLARTDQARVGLSAETMDNWIPRVLGSMALRPGLGYLGAMNGNGAPKMIPFVFSTSDTALIELTDSTMRIWKNDALITRPSVSTTVTNGTFDSNLTGWTDSDDSGGASTWATGGYMQLVGDGTNYAIRDQQVAISVNDVNRAHALSITVNRGPILLRVGTSIGDDSYVSETSLMTGYHSIAFTPTGNFWVRFKSNLKRAVLLDSCTVASSGTMTVTTPWPSTVFDSIRYDQSGDVVFVACDGYQQRRIERRDNDSWSVVLYAPEDGPFMTENVTATTITAAAISGNTTLTGSKPIWTAENVGGLYQIVSKGQQVSVSVSAENTFTSTIQVTGTGTARSFTIIRAALTGTGTTVTLQRSFDTGVSWIDVTTYTTTSTGITFTDGLDDQIVLYRIGVKTGDYSSGTITLTLAITTGSITGVARITSFTSQTSVAAEIITDLGGTTATDTWSEGSWSDRRGWPGAVLFHEGRLWWAGKNGVWGSVSDAYDSFDPNFVGDAGPINRVIGSGPVDTVNWLISLQRMIVGAQGAEMSVRSSSFDEPLTPTNFNMKAASTQGSAAVQAAKIDQRGIYVQRGGTRVFELAFDVASYDYNSKDITTLVPEVCSPGIVRMAVQRQPDTRFHCVRSDGTVAMATFDKNEDVMAWFTVTTDGTVEDVVILPGTSGTAEDQVYYVVNRTINSSTVRYLEKWAAETSCRGGTQNLQADAYVTFTASTPTTTITGLSHLEGESVIVWADGADLSPDTNDTQTTYTVSGGQITVGTAVSSAVIGLPYDAQWKSAKLGHALGPSLSVLNQHKRIDGLGLIMAYVHAYGLKYGKDFDTLYDLPRIEDGTAVSANALRTSYDKESFAFPGEWSTGTRLCLRARAPRPVTVLAATCEMQVSA